MSLFEKSLLNVIAKASKEYETVAKNDPIVKSTEDGSIRGDMLDIILRQQRTESKELWDKLYQLEAENAQKEDTAVFEEQPATVTATPHRKYLATLMYEYRDLCNLYDQELKKIDSVKREDDIIMEIEFREQLDKEIEQYKAATEFINQQLQQVNMSLRNENVVLNESKEVYNMLKTNERESAEVLNTVSCTDIRRKQMALEAIYKKDTADLTLFLDTYFPPHPLDNARPLGDECDLKLILEQLMNHAFVSPDDPYIKLESGSYWSPYIQTLMKARIAKYHPEDSTLIRLNDFSS